MTSPVRSEPVATSAPGQPTTVGLSEATHKRIEQERDNAGDDWKALIVFRDYAAGKHTSTLTSQATATLRMLIGRDYADNLCKVVLRAATDRLALERFTVDPLDESDAAKADAGDVIDYLAGVMTRNGGGSLQGRIHYAAVRDGNTAVSLRWDNDRRAVRLRPEPWWDGTSGVWVAYDGDGEPEYAVRDWRVEELVLVDGRYDYRQVDRRVVWWRDRIERYQKDGQGWKPAPKPGEPETGIVDWKRGDGTPLGIPVIHFAANADDDHAYGMSDLGGGVLGLQDEINDIQRSVTGAARHAGFPMYFASGIKQPKATTENPNPPPLRIEVEPGLWITVDAPEARAMVLEAGQIAPLLDAYNLKVKAICRMTGTPEHEITGVWPSGEALLRAEIGLVQRVERLQDLFSGPWTTVAHRCTELANAFGKADLDEEATIGPEWSSADRRDPLSVATVQSAQTERLLKVESLRSEWALKEAGVPDGVAREIAELNRMDGIDGAGDVGQEE